MFRSLKDYVVKYTMEYGMFEVTPENRKVRDNEATKALRESFLKFGFLPMFPIWVYKNGNGKLKIKAGHHRFKMAQELGLPIYYIIYPNVGSLYDFEHATNRWVIINFLESLVNSNPQYQKVLDYYMKTGIPISTVIGMLSGTKNSLTGGRNLKEFKKGEFVPVDTKHADTVGNIVAYLKDIGIKFASSRSFVIALSDCIKLNDFNVELFKRKSKTNIGEFQKRSSREEYLEIIDSVYNKFNSKKLNISWSVKNTDRYKKENVA
jgi:hypothetical protein